MRSRNHLSDIWQFSKDDDAMACCKAGVIIDGRPVLSQ